MSGKNRLFKSGETIRLWSDFCRSRISARFGKSAGFRPEPEPKSGTALFKSFKPSGQETDLSYSTATGALSSRNVQCAKYM